MLLIFLGAGTGAPPAPETRGRGGASDMPEDAGGSESAALWVGGAESAAQSAGGAGDG